MKALILSIFIGYSLPFSLLGEEVYKAPKLALKKKELEQKLNIKKKNSVLMILIRLKITNMGPREIASKKESTRA